MEPNLLSLYEKYLPHSRVVHVVQTSVVVDSRPEVAQVARTSVSAWARYKLVVASAVRGRVLCDVELHDICVRTLRFLNVDIARSRG